jgi:predicted enzyme related to lactoylglutathione lyase
LVRLDEPSIGEFSRHELRAADYAKAFTFYEAIFGWEKIEAHDMGPMGVHSERQNTTLSADGGAERVDDPARALKQD